MEEIKYNEQTLKEFIGEDRVTIGLLQKHIQHLTMRIQELEQKLEQAELKESGFTSNPET